MAGGGKDSIHYLKQDVPKFIREFKERTNQTPTPDINSKRPTNNDSDDVEKDNEHNDEAPTIDISSGVSAEEAKEFIKETFPKENASHVIEHNLKRFHYSEDVKNESEKVVFKKPSKEKAIDEKSKRKSQMKKVKNSNLLSFGGDEEDDDE